LELWAIVADGRASSSIDERALLGHAVKAAAVVAARGGRLATDGVSAERRGSLTGAQRG